MIVKSPITAIAVPKLLKNAHILYAQSIIILKTKLILSYLPPYMEK